MPAGFAFCSRCGAGVEQRAGGDPLLEKVCALFGRDLEIERELGRGGMAVVYAAYDPALQRRVAVKVLLPEIADEPDMSERFQREARTVAALQHPNVVSIYGVRTDGVVSAIVMQFVEGRSLDVVLRERASPLPLPATGLILAQVTAGLQHAHERGIVHRDVKPANVLLDKAGWAVVSDFGIARREGGTRLTESGVLIGTLAYMSPEQGRGERVGPASDQYSFGVMAYELLSGSRPFTGTLAEILNSQVNDAPRPLRERRPDLPATVESFVMRALEKKPGDRHPHMREAERVFRSLVPDTTAATTVLVGLSQVRAAAGSTVRPAITLSNFALLTAAPLVTTEPAHDAASQIVAPVPTAAVERPATAAAVPLARRRSRVIVAATAVVVLGALIWAWRFARTSSDAAAASIGATAPQTSDPARGSTRSGVGAPASASPKAQSDRAVRGGPQSASGVANTGAATAAGAATASSGGGEGATAKAARGDSASSLEAASPAGAGARSTAPPNAAPNPVPPAVSATLADARAVARAFVTLCNQRRWRDLELLGSVEGDAALRAEIVRLVHTAPDFAAGFDRVASTPSASGDGFSTEFVIDLEWRGGKRLAMVRLQAVSQNGAWKLAAFGVSPAD